LKSQYFHFIFVVALFFQPKKEEKWKAKKHKKIKKKKKKKNRTQKKKKKKKKKKKQEIKSGIPHHISHCIIEACISTVEHSLNFIERYIYTCEQKLTNGRGRGRGGHYREHMVSGVPFGPSGRDQAEQLIIKFFLSFAFKEWLFDGQVAHHFVFIIVWTFFKITDIFSHTNKVFIISSEKNIPRKKSLYHLKIYLYGRWPLSHDLTQIKKEN
jgi:hypothetical protein